MNNKDIQKARKNYAKRQKEKEELIKLKEELEQLENNSYVRRYLEILHVGEILIPSEELIIRSCFSGITKDSDDFKIYLYMGSYVRALCFDQSDTQVFDKSKADYLLYINIGDDSDIIQISPSLQEEFERKNVVLKTKTVNAQSKYYELQAIYYEHLLKDDLRKKGKILEKLRENL